MQICLIESKHYFRWVCSNCRSSNNPRFSKCQNCGIKRYDTIL